MTNRSLLLSGLFSAALFACAGDPNKQANDAHDAELKSERKQQQSAADERADTRVNAAEVKRDDTNAVATGSTATKQTTAADAKMTEARDVYRAKATERLEKVDARIVEMKALLAKAGAKATTSARDSVQTVLTQRGMVTTSLDRLPTVSNDGFKQAQDSLDSQLESLEGLVKKAAAEVDKSKK
ncbi:hypothetical protein BH11MYX4_BH11MYX4_11850 [soil metagenome]